MYSIININNIDNKIIFIPIEHIFSLINKYGATHLVKSKCYFVEFPLNITEDNDLKNNFYQNMWIIYMIYKILLQ